MITFFLTSFDIIKQNLLQNNIPLQLLALFGILPIAFFVIWGVEKGVRGWQWSKPIQIKGGIGEVDGIWIDAVVKNGEIDQASRIVIGSSMGEGFTVSGESYKVNKGVLDPRPCGSFRGERGSLFANGYGISYGFKGIYERQEHSGIAYYEFRIDKGNRYFNGAFLAREDHSAYLVIGWKLEKTTDEGALILLRNFVTYDYVKKFAETGRMPPVM